MSHWLIIDARLILLKTNFDVSMFLTVRSVVEISLVERSSAGIPLITSSFSRVVALLEFICLAIFSDVFGTESFFHDIQIHICRLD